MCVAYIRYDRAFIVDQETRCVGSLVGYIILYNFWQNECRRY